MENFNEIKSRLKWLRRSLGMTQEEFAEKMDISQSTYSHIEKGGKSNLTLGQTLLLFERLDVSPNWLLLGRGNKFLKEEPAPRVYVTEEEQAPYQAQGSQESKKGSLKEEVLHIKAFLRLKFPDFD
ncbi:MAG: helix-turn-helix transcriptional regulator [Phaeodactylibacter sp.]|nr:helix-turn-helix transcriptional regulator [Phaeodactylibacter sp.]